MSLVGFSQSGELKGKINNHLFNPAEKRLNSISEEWVDDNICYASEIKHNY